MISIGAYNTAEIVKLANSQFENGMVPKNRLIRQIELEKIENKAQANWDKCDEKFYLYQDDLTELLWDFIIKNKSDFKN